MKYQPDIIISVHPLMQHVPLRILRSKGLLKKIIFTTVVTDLSTCHPTWYILLVIQPFCYFDPCTNFALQFHIQVSQTCYQVLLSIRRGIKTSTEGWSQFISNKSLWASCTTVICEASSSQGRCNSSTSSFPGCMEIGSPAILLLYLMHSFIFYVLLNTMRRCLFALRIINSIHVPIQSILSCFGVAKQSSGILQRFVNCSECRSVNGTVPSHR